MSPSPNSVKRSGKSQKNDKLNPTRAVVTQFYQTKLCKHFQNGSCLYGDECSFSHSTDSIRERPNLTKTKLCPAVELGGTCDSVARCPYAHNLLELRATPMLFRTVMCSWWKKGQCEFGASCRFAHGDSELRESSDSSPTHTPLNTPQNLVASPFSHYPAVFAAALAAANQAVPVFSPQQAMAVSAAASAAALEAISRLTSESVNSSICTLSSSLRKGFASSPALLEKEERVQSRDRAGSDPGLNTDAFLEELRKLWIEPPEAPVAVIPLMRSDPFLSASHMTLDSYQINID